MNEFDRKSHGRATWVLWQVLIICIIFSHTIIEANGSWTWWTMDLSIVWLGKSCTIILPACCRHACHVTRLGHPANCGFAGSILIMNPSVGDAQMVYCAQGTIDGNHKQCHQNSRIYSLQYSIEIDSLTETVHTCSTTRHDETRHIIWILCSIEGLQSHSVQMDPSSCGKCPSNIPNNSFYPRSLWF